MISQVFPSGSTCCDLISQATFPSDMDRKKSVTISLMTVLCSSNASLRDRQLKPNYIILFSTLCFLVGLPLLDLFTLQPREEITWKSQPYNANPRGKQARFWQRNRCNDGWTDGSPNPWYQCQTGLPMIAQGPGALSQPQLEPMRA